MNKKNKNVLLAILVGLAFPALILSVPRKISGPAISVAPTETMFVQEQQVAVLFKDGTVQDMRLDEYVTCVVLREMPADFETEALKAQAIVARTYTLRRVKNGGKHKNAVVCVDSSCCQGFVLPEDYIKEGGKEALLDRVRKAVADTKDRVIVYDNQLIDATYFSCSGGSTEDALAVWGADIPYLQATQSPGEENASHHVDTVTFSATEFLSKLSLDRDKPIAIGKIKYTDGGGVDTIDICGKEFNGTDIREKLNLRSTAFVISVVGNTVTVTTKGFGHRVGMSQYGAEAMAVAGSTCDEILTRYYKGVQIIKYPI